MSGESPLGMMRPQPRRPQRRAAVAPRRRRLWPTVLPLVIVVILAVVWTWLWYYAASVADRTLTGWIDREAKAGRAYSCQTQTIGGFPFRIEARCAGPAAAINSNNPPFAVHAKDVVFESQVYHPTLLTGEITGPLTLAETNQPASFVANWSRARMSVRGLPPDPERVSVTVDHPRLDRGAGGEMIFGADHVDLRGRIIAGSASNNPVIDVSGSIGAATAPTLHPLLAEPIEGQVDAVLRGFKDLSPKPWSERFREMQAAGGGVDIKSLRIARPNAIIVGTGTLTVNEHGRLDGLVRVAIVGIETIVPLLGIDQLIGQGINRITGSGGSPAQGLGALDRLMPGLSGVVRDSTNASLIENLKKMGQPTEIDKKPAILLPLRFSDGAVYLGMIRVGQVPALF